MKQIPAPILTLIAGIAITLISVWYGNHNDLLPVQASVQAPMVDNLFNVMVMMATALFIIVQGTIIYFAIRYRRPKGDDSDGIPLEGNLELEAFWTAIPAIIVIGLGIYSVDVYRDMGGLAVGHQGMHSASMMGQAEPTLVAEAPSPVVSDTPMLMADAENMDDLSDPPVANYGFGAAPGSEGQSPDVLVNVKGLQFAWLYTYPDGGMTTGILHIPADKDVQLNIEAQDVLHAFWVPAFRLKQDAIPGKTTQLRFVANRPGTYDVVCAELCGSYHGAMRSQVVVETQEEFDQWVADNRIAQAPGKSDGGNVSEAIANNTSLSPSLAPSLNALPSDAASMTAQTLPVDTQHLSKEEYLAPYGDDLELDVNHLPHAHHHHVSQASHAENASSIF